LRRGRYGRGAAHAVAGIAVGLLNSCDTHRATRRVCLDFGMIFHCAGAGFREAIFGFINQE